MISVTLFAAMLLWSAPQNVPTTEIDAIDRATRRGVAHLLEAQREDGSFAPEGERDVCRVALTAMALWSLAETKTPSATNERLERAARYLVNHARDNGGIYDPTRGLAVYTSGISSRALRALGPRTDWPELATTLNEVELFTYRRATPESFVDTEITEARTAGVARELAAKMLSQSAEDSPRRRALAFLARCDSDTLRHPSRVRIAVPQRNAEPSSEFTYDDLLPLVYFELAPEQQLAQRAFAALRRHYTPDRNPDLTKRYGADGFGAGTQGLFYYYFVCAKALSVMGDRNLITADGVVHDWASEIASRLLALQRPGGSWANRDSQWWEAEPVLATSYALLTLHMCRARLVRNAAAR